MTTITTMTTVTTTQRLEHAALRLRAAEAQAADLRRALRDEVVHAIDSAAFTRRQIAEACDWSWPAAYGALDHADRDAFQSLADLAA